MIRPLTAVAIVILCFNVEGYSQHIECIGDVIEIPLTGHKAGAIQWQFSNDLVTWTDLEGEVGDELTTTIQETGYFRAEVTDNSCTYYSDTVNILAFLPPTVADAGEDQILTDGTTSFTLSANTPETGQGIGQWSILSGEGGSFDDPTNPTTTFTGQMHEYYELKWSIATSCDFSTDTVVALFGQITAGNTVTDIDDNTYNTIWIGTQQWMAENLKTTKYNDGTDIKLILDYTVGVAGYSWYNNDQATYGDTYGALYNWYAVEKGNLCPAGWHVASDEDWSGLINYFGGEFVAGGKLKETDTTHWESPNTGATNESGFTALPGGCRYNLSFGFDDLGFGGYWWSATEIDTDHAWSRDIGVWYIDVVRRSSWKESGFSVRCIKD